MNTTSDLHDEGCFSGNNGPPDLEPFAPPRADTGGVSPRENSIRGDEDDRSICSVYSPGEDIPYKGVGDVVAETGCSPHITNPAVTETGSSPDVGNLTNPAVTETGSSPDVGNPAVTNPPADAADLSPSPALPPTPEVVMDSQVDQQSTSSLVPEQAPDSPKMLNPSCASGPNISALAKANRAEQSRESKPDVKHKFHGRGSTEKLCMKQESLLLGHLQYPPAHVITGKLISYTRDSDQHQHVIAYSHCDLATWGGFPGLLCKASVFRLKPSLPKQTILLATLSICTMLMMQHIIRTVPIPDDPEASDNSLFRRLQNVNNGHANVQFEYILESNPNAGNAQWIRRDAFPRLLQDDGGGGDGDGDDGDDEEEENKGEGGGMSAKEYWREQVLPLIELSGYANTLVVFLLGVFLSINIQRWWRFRSVHLQGILKASRNIVWSFAAILPDAKFDHIRQEVARHTLLSFRLLFICARTRPRVTHKELATLQVEGLLTPSETQALLQAIDKTDTKHSYSPNSWNFSKGSFDLDLAEIPWQWNCTLVQTLFRKGHFPPPIMALLTRVCLEARTGIDGIGVQLNSQLPFAYSHLIALLVQSAVSLNSVKCGLLLALSETELSMLCQMIFSLCLCLVYLGLLALTAVIADPFGDDIIDLPSAHLMQQLWHNCSMLDSMRRSPEVHRGELKRRSKARKAASK